MERKRGIPDGVRSHMKCYVCGQEASVSMREQAMFMGREFTKFLCRNCYDSKRWK